jgi:hypothetical protein
MTKFGFFSVVQKPGEDVLTVRARVRGDLDALREGYLPELGETLETPRADYGYRAHVGHAAFGEALRRIGEDVDYPNFKNAVRDAMGARRAKVYGKVWGALFELARSRPDV